MLVQDTKRPNREPFEVSEDGLKFLQRKNGNRYVPVQKIDVTPQAITVTPRVIAPAKAKKG